MLKKYHPKHQFHAWHLSGLEHPSLTCWLGYRSISNQSRRRLRILVERYLDNQRADVLSAATRSSLPPEETIRNITAVTVRRASVLQQTSGRDRSRIVPEDTTDGQQ